MDEEQDKIRQKAYQIWQEEGCPEGRSDVHWDMARELVAQQENYLSTTKPVGDAEGRAEDSTIALDNQGDFPTLTDQGEMEAPRKVRPRR
ncbi:MAG: hypothetical protein B7Y12_11040 [Rhizobiales bacterium 24-66-13]|jgi:hypothetical protein|nr:MAG: hypothetical protein B7Y61_06550 [Rhizobiales bacterium 35-66-30]OYZ76899.1 MAG: hypothetical protein B7Y12_11040 [Rhizobiales bacterium 24-66-13]OZB06382.1 MAG: hypothetical protein B7X67_10470 [Rhizobiales bacterium 39-66-18]HQS08998.1 DUF2934 domain-containing protein [Xanthobacteraceae bacterium]HQS50085.1 DUF2934 domain-containing protein [Xanthobacteraceae bacterium]